MASAPAEVAFSSFAPGSIVAGRYRLVALLGRGGMGEVYRADDLTLDNPVALKFLPADVASNPQRLAQFHNELRVARHVSHKNVCRLYDIGEADGRPFITMEYVDGEDLASLLRRIGRIPQDKAVDIARQLCAGVLAAHERGVIHRDLKPANVMLDGDGNVRITDFGIATAAGAAADVHLGTPQYMAPEQLDGRPASVASDIYALGLILFEVFTGKRAFDAKTIAELRQFHDTSTLTTPTAIVRDLDPAVERVIMRCLQRDPERRPASALGVAAALPGSDPLAAALAAGETPSPDLLVAAAEIEAIPVGRGLALLGALVLGLAVYIAISPAVTMAALASLDKPPAVLADRATALLAALGYGAPAADDADGLMISGDYARWRVQADQTPGRWAPATIGRGPALLYWYRTSPVSMVPLRFTRSVVTANDPPFTTSGMVRVIFDTQGQLQNFDAVPPQHDPGRGAGTPPDWQPLFQASGLSMASFREVAPEWTPAEYADTRIAWVDDRAGSGPVRVEAAAYGGRPVSFAVIEPWTEPSRTPVSPQGAFDRALSAFSIVMAILVMLGGALLARRNLRAGRADQRTAARLAVGFVILETVVWIAAAHHVPDVAAEAQTFLKTLAIAGLNAGLVWVVYLAVEPYGRRFWPDGLLGWTRLFSGHIRDPRIGRDILTGAALGGALLIVDVSRAMAPLAIGRPPGIPALGFSVNSLVSTGLMALEWEQQTYNSVETALFVVMVLVALRLFLRRTWIAVVVTVLVVAAAASANMPPGGTRWIDAIFAVAAIGLVTFGVFRFGLLVTVVMLVADNIVSSMPFALHPAAWWSAPGYLSAILIVALGAFGFYAARAGQPLFGKWLEE